MNWKDRLRPRIWTFVIILILLMITTYVDAFYSNTGGINYRNLPFRIQQTSCGTDLVSAQNCTYPLVPGGIILSILFWLAIYAIISLLINRPTNNIPSTPNKT